MRIRPLCYAGVLGSVSEDHASRAIRQARCSPEEAGLCEYDTLRSLRIAVLPRRGTLSTCTFSGPRPADGLQGGLEANDLWRVGRQIGAATRV